MKYQIYLADDTEIEAQRVTRVGPFIVHENVDLTWRRENDLDILDEFPNRWTITHLDSSFKLQDFKTKKEALTVSRALRDSEIEWDKLERDGYEMTYQARKYFSENVQTIKKIMKEALND